MKNILILVILTTALIFTSLVKNKTRILEKEIASLNDSIANSNFKLTAAIIEFEFLTTPKNNSFLVNNHLEEDFSYYKKSQIMEAIKVSKISDVGIKNTIYLYENSDSKKEENSGFSGKAQRWAGIQILKAVLGIPVVPGK